MTRIGIILFCLLYTFSATGATAYLHYCCSERPQLVLHSEALDVTACNLCADHEEEERHCSDDGHGHPDKSHDTTDKGACGGEEAAGHCQGVKVEAKKTTAEHPVPGADKNIAKIYPLELFAFTLAGMVDVSVLTAGTPHTVDDPSPHTAVPLFIQHCTYRI